MIDPKMFDAERLAATLLGFNWQRDCEIVPNYVPPFPRAGQQPMCGVRWLHKESGEYSWLRHSKGPLQGHGWDCYGDDYLNPELALIALSQAPPPPRFGLAIPNYGRAFNLRDGRVEQGPVIQKDSV